MDSQNETIRAVYSRTLWKDDSTGWSLACFRLLDTGRYITVSGTALPSVSRIVADLTGTWGRGRKTGGKVFNVESYELPRVDRIDALTAYLGSLKCGLGPSKVRAIYDVYGEKTWDVIHTAPEQLITIQGIGEGTVAGIKRAVKNSENGREIAQLCAGAGVSITAGQIQKILARLGEDCAGEVRVNPYLLTAVRGFSFEKADAVAASLGFPKNYAPRLEAGTMAILAAAAASGHTCLPLDASAGQLRPALLPELVSALDISMEDAKKAVRSAFDAGKIRAVADRRKNFKVFTSKSYEEEASIASDIRRLMHAPAERFADMEGYISDYEKEYFPLAESQREAVRKSAECNVSVITGGPGTGKTTVTKAILYVFSKLCGDGFTPVLLAPTGKAARRLSEATGHSAETVHQAVGFRGEEVPVDGEMQIEGDLIIVDEASMLDQFITAELLRKTTSGTRLVFVGDPDQLPSVGAGNILHDLIASGAVPVTRLSVIFRQERDNPIITNSHRMLEGISDMDYTGSFKFFETSCESETFKTASELYLHCVKTYGLDNVLLLNPQRRNSSLTTGAFNRCLQERLHADTALLGITEHGDDEPIMKSGDTLFRRGDRVMQLKNTETAKNGDIGYIREIRRVPDPDCAERFTNVSDIEFNADGVLHEYSYENMTDLDLAYCSTVHKAQGTEYRVVLMIVSEAHRAMLKRNVVYTGITRAKEYVALIGEKKALETAVRNDRVDVRYTCLAPRLRAA